MFALLLAATVLRWVFVAKVELSPDEAYYLMWSQRPDLAYISKGPGVAMAIRLGTAIFGENEFGVRFLSPLLALGTSLVVFFLARRIYGERVAIWTVVAMNAIPIFQVGALVMTIDPLSIFFWVAALWTFWLALEASPKFSVHWPLTGLFIGLGLLSKYTNAMQLLSVVLLLATERSYRREFTRAGFWTMLAVVMICAIPPLLWNQHHGWVTISNLKTRGHLDTPFAIRPMEWLSFFGAHIGVYSPLIFAGILVAAWRSLGDAPRSFPTRFLLWFAAPLLVMYAVLALNKAGQPNWTALAFASLGILTSAWWYGAAQTSRGAACFAIWALGIGVAMGLAITNMDLTWRLTAPSRHILAYLPAPEREQWAWLQKMLTGCQKLALPYPYGFDPSARLHGWKSAARTVEGIREKFEGESGQKVFMIANSYGAAAELAFYLPERRVEYPGHPPVYVPESSAIENQFSFWPRYDKFGEGNQTAGPNAFPGRTALFVTDRPDEGIPASLTDNFASTELIANCDLYEHGALLRTLRVYACRNYRPVSP